MCTSGLSHIVGNKFCHAKKRQTPRTLLVVTHMQFVTRTYSWKRVLTRKETADTLHPIVRDSCAFRMQFVAHTYGCERIMSREVKHIPPIPLQHATVHQGVRAVSVEPGRFPGVCGCVCVHVSVCVSVCMCVCVCVCVCVSV